MKGTNGESKEERRFSDGIVSNKQDLEQVLAEKKENGMSVMCRGS